MNYICADRGTDKCPCVLMETGQCYTCGMISRGKCDCPPSWQGVCPYNEYMENGRRVMSKTKDWELEIKSVEDFSANLKVITLEVTMGFALECRKMGSFLMVSAGGYKTPVSVMESKTPPPSYVKLAIYVTGPKTTAIDKIAETGGKLKVSGPFSNGMINSEKFDSKRLSLIIGKGMAIMPVLNCKDAVGSGLVGMYLDESKLTGEFLGKYVSQLEYTRLNMDAELEILKTAVENDCSYCMEHTGQKPNIFLMVSPYYKELIMEKCGLDAKETIVPNHANMCCGEGVCGACSHTDKDGITVRMCKCGPE